MITAGWYGDATARSGEEEKMEFVIGILLVVVLVLAIVYLVQRT